MSGNDINFHIYIHVVPSSAEQSISTKLDTIVQSQSDIVKVLEKLGAGGASAADIKSLTDRAKTSAANAQQVEKSAEDLEK
jgi:exosome complex RNA-binding protein Rrp42 (RNase PH superfamily)